MRSTAMDRVPRHYLDGDDRAVGTVLARSPAGDGQPRLLLTVEEAAHRIGVCRSIMFKLIREGDVRSVKVGRLRRVTPAALEDFVARLSRDGDEEPA
jgi:excisionase family DNA binding protein